VVLGIRPNRAETGYGYIEAGNAFSGNALRVLRFTEKPDAEKASAFVLREIISGIVGCSCGVRARWPMPCASIFPRPLPCWNNRRRFRHPKLCGDLPQALSQMREHQRRLRRAGTASAKGEQASNLFCLPADFGWNDLGSWTALHEHHIAKNHPLDDNVVTSAGLFFLNACGNYVHAPGKFVAAWA